MRPSIFIHLCGSICRAWLSTAAGYWTGSRTCTATCTATRAARTSSSTGARRRPAGMLPTASCQRTPPNFWCEYWFFSSAAWNANHRVFFFLFLPRAAAAAHFAADGAGFRLEPLQLQGGARQGGDGQGGPVEAARHRQELHPREQLLRLRPGTLPGLCLYND